MKPITSVAFLLTGLVGVWTTYAPANAQVKFYLLCGGIAGAHTLRWLCRIYGERLLGIVSTLCAVVASLLGILSFLPTFAPSEVIAGALIILLPLGTGGVLWPWRQQQPITAGASALLLGWGLLALAWTGERSAWLGLAVGACGGLVFVLQQKIRDRQMLSRWIGRLLGASILAGVAFYIGAIFAQGVPQWIPFADKFTVRDHFELWNEGLVMIQDYPFSGSGLASTAMIFSSYIYPLHVPMVEHVHNLYLQIAIEQGVAGLLAFLSMTVVAWCSVIFRMPLRPQDNGAHLAWSAVSIAALTSMLCHGLLDSGLYASHLVPILFLPFGFAAATAQLISDDAEATYRERGEGVASGVNRKWIVAVGWSAMGLALLISLTTLPVARAAYHTNLGTITQTHAELTLYTWPGWWNQDELRRANPALLEEATQHYEAALRINETNGTAHRRLGQIELSLGQYPLAVVHLERAYALAPQQRINVYLLGEAYAVTGRVEEAVQLWKGINWNTSQLTLRQQWYEYLGDRQAAAWMKEAITAKEKAVHR